MANVTYGERKIYPDGTPQQINTDRIKLMELLMLGVLFVGGIGALAAAIYS